MPKRCVPTARGHAMPKHGRAEAPKGKQASSRSGARKPGVSRAGEYQRLRAAAMKKVQDALDAEIKARVAAEAGRDVAEKQRQDMCNVLTQALAHMGHGDDARAAAIQNELAKLKELHSLQATELFHATQRAIKAEWELGALRAAPMPEPRIILAPPKPRRW